MNERQETISFLALRRRRFPAASIYCLLAGIGLAVPSLATDHPAARCATFFGDVEEHRANQESRVQSLDMVKEGMFAITIVHHCDWREPEPIRFQELELVGTRTEDPGSPSCIVKLLGPGEVMPCRPGTYLLHVDDSIGDSRILAILEGFVLLDRQGELRYLWVDWEIRPSWRMVWRSTWTLPRLQSTGGARPSIPPSKQRSRK